MIDVLCIVRQVKGRDDNGEVRFGGGKEWVCRRGHVKQRNRTGRRQVRGFIGPTRKIYNRSRISEKSKSPFSL